jgi:hypothetical protein
MDNSGSHPTLGNVPTTEPDVTDLISNSESDEEIERSPAETLAHIKELASRAMGRSVNPVVAVATSAPANETVYTRMVLLQVQ